MDFLRDVMVSKAGPGVPLLAATPGQAERLREVAGRWPLDTILAAFQVLDQAKRNLRGSSYGRMIVEFALVRAARLEDFAELGELIGRLGGGSGGPAPVKKKLRVVEEISESLASPEPPTPNVPRDAPARVLDLAAARAVWTTDLSSKLPLRLRMTLSRLSPSAVEPHGVLVVPVPSGYNGAAEECEAARGRIEATLGELLGLPVTLRFEPLAGPPADETAKVAARPSGSQAGEQLAADPFVRDVMQIFETPPFPFRVEHDEPSPEA